MMTAAEPKTLKEWQEIVDGAHAILIVDSMKQYGLIKGGPKVNINQCYKFLEEGKRLGITPDEEPVQDIVNQILIQYVQPRTRELSQTQKNLLGKMEAKTWYSKKELPFRISTLKFLNARGL